MTDYLVGTGISDITDPAIGLGMQGMADPGQKTTGVESRLFSRAFVAKDSTADKIVVLVIVDIWACTSKIKSMVIGRIQDQFGGVYTENNVLISGTHTHSAPGGYAGHKLYDLTVGGVDPHTLECIVSGIVKSIENAHVNLKPGRIYLNNGTVEDCGLNRSLLAYENNPISERNRYKSETDKSMMLLKFVALSANGGEQAVGVLSWYPIHPTDRGQKNTLVCGDNKGYASSVFETWFAGKYPNAETFVAAFANSNCGDVSGNVEYGTPPDGIQDKAHMEKHGRQQFEAAKQLFESANEALQGSIDFLHTRIDMSNVVIDKMPGMRTWPAALGLSFAAGSSEDSYPVPDLGLKEGITEGEVSVGERIVEVAATLLAGLFEGIPTALAFDETTVKGHLPKPVLFALGASNVPLVPSHLPLQIIKIGSFAMVAIPGEITTMAGRRLRETVLGEFSQIGVKHLALATYANEYSQYISTKEEYDMQHYEGASTLFGPFTLMAYQQEFQKLAHAMGNGLPVNASPAMMDQSSPALKRLTVRNLSGVQHSLKFFNSLDEVELIPLPDGEKQLPPDADLAWYVPPDIGDVRIEIDGKQNTKASQGNLVTIKPDGLVDVSNYHPPYA